MTKIDDKEIEIKWSLKLCRTKTGLSQEELATELGVAKETYQNYENGKTVMRIDTAVKFSEITGIPLNSIIFFEG